MGKLALYLPNVCGDFPDKYKVLAKEVDCEEGLAGGCKARCCTLVVRLTPQDIAEGIVEHDRKKLPYVNKIGEDGYCVHLGRETFRCTIWGSRPAVCRGYTCETDQKIWKR